MNRNPVASLCAAVLLGACLPAAHDLEGPACDGCHPCGDPLACQDNVCGAPYSTGPNLLGNGGFEKDLQNWDAYNGTSTIDVVCSPTRSGSGALRARKNPAGTDNGFGVIPN